MRGGQGFSKLRLPTLTGTLTGPVAGPVCAPPRSLQSDSSSEDACSGDDDSVVSKPLRRKSGAWYFTKLT